MHITRENGRFIGAIVCGTSMNPRPRLLTRPGPVAPFDPLLELRRAIATELAVMAFEARRRR